MDAHISTNITFGRTTIFEFANSRIDFLLQRGILHLTNDEMEEFPADEPRKLVGGELCLALQQDYLIREGPLIQREYTAPIRRCKVTGDPRFEDLELFSDYAWVASYDGGARALRLLSSDSLRTHLLHLANGFERKTHFDLLSYPIDLDPVPEALQLAESTGNFSGMWEVCSCGEPADMASYAWIKDGKLMLYLTEVGGPGLFSIWVLPAELTESEVESRRQEREQLLQARSVASR